MPSSEGVQNLGVTGGTAGGFLVVVSSWSNVLLLKGRPKGYHPFRFWELRFPRFFLEASKVRVKHHLLLLSVVFVGRV